MHHAAPIHVVTDGSHFRNLNSEITYYSNEVSYIFFNIYDYIVIAV